MEGNNGLPQNWVLSSLGECCLIARGGSPRPIKEFLTSDADGVNWIKISDATASDKYIYTTKEKIKPSGIVRSRLVNEGDFLLSNSMSFGRPYIMRTTGCIHDGWLVLSEYEKYFNQGFLYHLLSSPIVFKQFNQLAAGSTVRNLNIELASRAVLPVPPFHEQHRIVAKIEALFSELDKGIESFKTAREQLKIYRQALLKHAFSGKLTEQWRAENQDKLETVEALLQRIQTEREQRYQQQLKDWEATGKQGSKPKAPKTLPPLTTEELAESELPKGWAWTRFGELIESSQNGLSKRGGDSGTEYVVLRLADITNQKIYNEHFREIKLTPKEVNQYKLSKHDLLCIRVNGSVDLIGRMILVHDSEEWAYCDHFIRYRVLNKVCNSAFVSYFFNVRDVRKYIELNCVSSAGQNTVNQDMLGSVIVAFCSIDEQNQILLELETKLSEIDQLDQTLTTALQQAEALRQSILKKAFSGQLVPQDPNDEPASVLMECIQAEKAALIAPTKKGNNYA